MDVVIHWSVRLGVESGGLEHQGSVAIAALQGWIIDGEQTGYHLTVTTNKMKKLESRDMNMPQ